MKTVAALPQAGRYLARSLAQSLRLMVGLPDYDVYLSHMERTHPGQAPMSYEAFFRERLEARYGGGKGRCC
ncbi:YbdD/YjiX family protein [Variovorax sp. J22R24]|uniref:YbdD/YjiX family protein n=1 Tax=Variovorax gracilis TaxID=3053502 RepID=UPI002574ACBC|nr:YbdD/YjiX family protein [Variovorax sp. J22R24]MDM0109078.1 YbdD/YjiX family protein [Variovorax sp. J22R24]